MMFVLPPPRDEYLRRQGKQYRAVIRYMMFENGERVDADPLPSRVE